MPLNQYCASDGRHTSMNSITQCSDSLNNSGLAFSFSFFKPLLTHPFLRTVQLRTVYDQKKRKEKKNKTPARTLESQPG